MSSTKSAGDHEQLNRIRAAWEAYDKTGYFGSHSPGLIRLVQTVQVAINQVADRLLCMNITFIHHNPLMYHVSVYK